MDSFYSPENKIRSAAERKPYLLRRWANYPLTLHTSGEEGYDWLDPGDWAITLANPFGGDELEITGTDEFTLYFNDWHAHYFLYEQEFQVLVADAEGILDGTKCALVLEIGGKWMLSRLEDVPPKPAQLTREALLEGCHLSAGEKERLQKEPGTLSLRFWDPARNRTISL